MKRNTAELAFARITVRESETRFNGMRVGSLQRICIALATLLLLVNPAAGSVIVSTLTSSIRFGSGFPVVNSPVPGLNGYAVGWTQTTAYTNVAIQARVATTSLPLT